MCLKCDLTKHFMTKNVLEQSKNNWYKINRFKIRDVLVIPLILVCAVEQTAPRGFSLLSAEKLKVFLFDNKKQ